jgi:hypothetical protein
MVLWAYEIHQLPDRQASNSSPVRQPSLLASPTEQLSASILAIMKHRKLDQQCANVRVEIFNHSFSDEKPCCFRLFEVNPPLRSFTKCNDSWFLQRKWKLMSTNHMPDGIAGGQSRVTIGMVLYPWDLMRFASRPESVFIET